MMWKPRRGTEKWTCFKIKQCHVVFPFNSKAPQAQAFVCLSFHIVSICCECWASTLKEGNILPLWPQWPTQLHLVTHISAQSTSTWEERNRTRCCKSLPNVIFSSTIPLWDCSRSPLHGFDSRSFREQVRSEIVLRLHSLLEERNINKK